MTNTPASSVGRLSLATAAAVGGCVGLAIGSAYVAGALARSSADDARGRLVAGALAPPGPGRRHPLPSAAAGPVRPVALHLARVDLRGPAAPPRDLECLSQAVYYEARGEVERGREAVAQVVVNRTRQGRFPRSICGVVFQHARVACAFSFACDGQTRHALEPAAWRDARRIAQRTLAGFTMPELKTATDFRGGGGGAPSGLARIAQIGGHVFYRWTGRRTAAPVAAKPQLAGSPPAQALVKADAPVKTEAVAPIPAA